MNYVGLVLLLAAVGAGCGSGASQEDGAAPPPDLAVDLAAFGGCGKDTDCKGDRICVRGECVDPPPGPADAASRDLTPAPDLAGPALLGEPGAAVPLGAGRGGGQIAAADLNGDGKADLVVADQMNARVLILLGKGDGTFQPASGFAAGGEVPLAVVASDFDGDGRTDVAVANRGATLNTGTAALLIGNGDGSLKPAVAVMLADMPISLAAGDLNGDGRRDLIVANRRSNAVVVIINGGPGNLSKRPPVPLYFQPQRLTAADLNGDGKLDVAVTTVSPPGDGGAITEGGVHILLGAGDGSLAMSARLRAPVGASAVLARDLSEDGKPDLALGLISNAKAAIAVMPGLGGGAFGPATTYAATTQIREFAAADFDRDGRIDIAAGDTNGLLIFLNGGKGAFRPGVVWWGAAYGAESLAVADFNGDGKTDVAIRDYWTNVLRIMLNISR